MSEVVFDDFNYYRLAEQFLRAPGKIVDIQLYPEQKSAQVADERLARLLKRLEGDTTVILPYPVPKEGADYWLITGKERRLVEQTLSRLRSFLGPSYGYFKEGPRWQRFQATGNPLQQAAAPLFPIGYYRWESPIGYRDQVLERLMMWLDLERQRPTAMQSVIKTYRQLHSDFEKALTDHHWIEAEQYLEEMRQRYLSTAENLTFLRLQLLAAREAWTTIWQDDDYPLWTQLQTTRAVRTLLLTAFHICCLYPLEKQQAWAEALHQFRENRPRLGLLLTGPFQFDKPPVVRVLAYQAMTDGDLARLNFLRQLGLDQEIQNCLDALAQLPAPAPPIQPPPTLTPLEQVQEALQRRDFATAERLVDQLSEKTERALLLLEMAFHSHDMQLCHKAWANYQALTFEEQEALRQHERFVALYLEDLQNAMLPTILDESEEEPATPSWSAGSAREQEAYDEAWKKIKELENKLRLLISRQLEGQFGPNWVSRLNPEMVAGWQETRTRNIPKEYKIYDLPEEPLINYSYLSQLVDIITGPNWQFFREVFGADKKSKTEVRDKLISINRVRNPLAHNRLAPLNELKRTDVYCTDLLLMINQFMK